MVSTNGMRSISIDVLEPLANHNNIVREEIVHNDANYLLQVQNAHGFFTKFWTKQSHDMMIKTINVCGVHAINYLYDVLYDEFSETIQEFRQEKMKKQRHVSDDDILLQFWSEMSNFIFGMAGQAVRDGEVKIVDRYRKCQLSGNVFADSDYGGSTSRYNRRLPKLEVLNYKVDIQHSRLDAFKRVGDSDDVIGTMQEYRNLIDYLSFLPPEKSTEISILSNLSRDRYYEAIRLMEKCYYPFRYAKIHGGHIKALFETGCLGHEPIIKTSIGYKTVAEDGHLCSSLSEKIIDDWLYRNGIPHKKEPAYPNKVRELCGGNVRADWLVDDVYIEFFGLQTKSEYAQKTERKLWACHTAGVKVVSLFPGDELRLDRTMAWIKKSAG